VGLADAGLWGWSRNGGEASPTRYKPPDRVHRPDTGRQPSHLRVAVRAYARHCSHRPHQSWHQRPPDHGEPAVTSPMRGAAP